VPIRVLLVDPRLLFRQGLRSLLERDGGFTVVGEAAEVQAACALADDAVPDVVLSELELDGLSGVALVEALARRDRPMPVMLLTQSAERHHVQHALAAGVRGYVLKSQPFADVAAAIVAVVRGERYLAPGLAPLADGAARRRVGASQASFSSLAEVDDPCWQLSPREREVFHLLVRGFDNRYIATRLGVTAKTVETHRAHLFRKLEAHSIADLLRFAARNHLLPTSG